MASVQLQRPISDQITLQTNQVQKPCEEANMLQSSTKCGEQINAGSKMKVVTLEVMKVLKEQMHLQHHSNQTQQHQTISQSQVVQAEHQIKYDSICSNDGKVGHVSEKAKKDKSLEKEKDKFLGKKNEQGNLTPCKSPKTKDKKDKKDKKEEKKDKKDKKEEKKDKKKNKDKDNGTSSSDSSESYDDVHEKKKKQDKEKKKHE